jgi:hypothetical protein
MKTAETLEIFKVTGGKKKRWFESKAQLERFWDGNMTGSGRGNSQYYNVEVFQLEWTPEGNVWKKIRKPSKKVDKS